MEKKEDKNTRYYIDIDLSNRTILDWDFGNKFDLAQKGFENPFQHRIFISRGQYKKFARRISKSGSLFL